VATALVTGANRGIGLAITEKLLSLDMMVFACVRQTSDLTCLNELKKIYGDKVIIQVMDITSTDSVKTAMKSILKRVKRVDVAINNAAKLMLGTEETSNIDDAKLLFDTNYFGALRVVQAILPHMRANNSGHIINIGSNSGFRPMPPLSVYSASKFALSSLTETLALNVEPFNIKVTLVEPGPVSTDIYQNCKQDTNATKTPYTQYLQLAYEILSKTECYHQDAKEVAEIVANVISEPAPKFRYQTSALSTIDAENRLKSVDGVANLEQVREIMQTNFDWG